VASDGTVGPNLLVAHQEPWRVHTLFGAEIDIRNGVNPTDLQLACFRAGVLVCLEIDRDGYS
jgi:hypothetical protein